MERDNFSIESYLQEKKNFFEEEFYKILPVSDSISKNLFDAINYSARASGKRIRPILMFAATELFDGDINKILPFACAVECIHTYSLIHDDLPAMDNDDFRRGIPTCHKAFDEATAILAGDGLLTYAFEILTDVNNFFDIPKETILRCINTLAKASGVFGMVGGQMGDMYMQGKDSVTSEDLLWIHSHKTGAIINASLEIGATIGGASESEINIVKDYGKNLGLAFQIKDDLLDVEGDSSIMGKPVGSDKKKKKLTFLQVFGIEKTKEMLSDYTFRAINCIKYFGNRANPLIHLAHYVENRIK